MKIAFYGSSLLSSYWNGAATYYRGLLKDLAARGYEITFYEPDAYDRQKHRDIDPPDWATSGLPGDRGRRCARVIAEAARADVVVKASGVGVFDDELLDGPRCTPPGPMPSGSSGTSTPPPRWPSCAASRTIRCATH